MRSLLVRDGEGAAAALLSPENAGKPQKIPPSAGREKDTAAARAAKSEQAAQRMGERRGERSEPEQAGGEGARRPFVQHRAREDGEHRQHPEPSPRSTEAPKRRGVVRAALVGGARV